VRVRLCRLRCRPRHLSDEGRRICNRDIRRCGRCRKYTFLDWGWRLCGSCYHALKALGGPGVRWRTAMGRRKRARVRAMKKVDSHGRRIEVQA
jgi:hypothetical protein